MRHLIGRLFGFAVLFTILFFGVYANSTPEIANKVIPAGVAIPIILLTLVVIGLALMLMITDTLSYVKTFVGWLKS